MFISLCPQVAAPLALILPLSALSSFSSSFLLCIFPVQCHAHFCLQVCLGLMCILRLYLECVQGDRFLAFSLLGNFSCHWTSYLAKMSVDCLVFCCLFVFLCIRVQVKGFHLLLLHCCFFFLCCCKLNSAIHGICCSSFFFCWFLFLVELWLRLMLLWFVAFYSCCLCLLDATTNAICCSVFCLHVASLCWYTLLYPATDPVWCMLLLIILTVPYCSRYQLYTASDAACCVLLCLAACCSFFGNSSWGLLLRSCAWDFPIFFFFPFQRLGTVGVAQWGPFTVVADDDVVIVSSSGLCLLASSTRVSWLHPPVNTQDSWWKGF